MLTTPISNAPKMLSWLYTRNGIAVWKSIDLSRPSGQLLTPADATKPAWWVGNVPTIITKSCEVEFTIDREIKRFHVAIRRSGNGLSLKLTDASTKKVHNAEEKYDGYTIFDHETQEAVIMVTDRKITMESWVNEQAPFSPKVFCINDRENEVKDPEITKDKFYKLVQVNVFIMESDPWLSVIGDNGIEVSRPKTSFIRL